MNNHLQSILKTLAQHQVDFVVCGGVAAVLHGVERMTLDIDISIDFSKENVRRFLVAINELELKPRMPLPADVLLDQQRIDKIVSEKNALVFSFFDSKVPYKHLDVFLTKQFDYHVLTVDCDIVSIGTDQVKVVSVKRLLAMKKSIVPLRDKDKLDIACLESLL